MSNSPTFSLILYVVKPAQAERRKHRNSNNNNQSLKHGGIWKPKCPSDLKMFLFLQSCNFQQKCSKLGHLVALAPPTVRLEHLESRAPLTAILDPRLLDLEHKPEYSTHILTDPSESNKQYVLKLTQRKQEPKQRSGEQSGFRTQHQQLETNPEPLYRISRFKACSEIKTMRVVAHSHHGIPGLWSGKPPKRIWPHYTCNFDASVTFGFC